MVGQTGVPFGIIDVTQLPISAAELNGQSGFFYRNAANLTGEANLSGSFSGNFNGTATNADLLDNLDSAYFRDGANLTGTINATQLNGESASYYRNSANLTGSFTSGSEILAGDGSGRFSNVSIGSGLLYTGGVLHATGAGGGEASGGTGSFSGFFTGVFYNKQVYDENILIPSGYNSLLVAPVGFNGTLIIESEANLILI